MSKLNTHMTKTGKFVMLIALFYTFVYYMLTVVMIVLYWSMDLPEYTTTIRHFLSWMIVIILIVTYEPNKNGDNKTGT